MQKQLLAFLTGVLLFGQLSGAEVFRNVNLRSSQPVSEAQKRDFAAAKLKFTGDRFPEYLHIYRHRNTAPGEAGFQSGALRINSPAGVRLEFERFQVSRSAMKKMLNITLKGSGDCAVELRVRCFNDQGKFVKTVSGGIAKFAGGINEIKFQFDPDKMDAGVKYAGVMFVITGNVELNSISGDSSEVKTAGAAPAAAPAAVTVPEKWQAAERLTFNADFADCLQADEKMKSGLAKRKVTLKSALFPEKWMLAPHGGAGTVEFIPGEPGTLKAACPKGIRLMGYGYRIRTNRIVNTGFLAEVTASGKGKVESRLICYDKAGKFIRTIRARKAMDFTGGIQSLQTLVFAEDLPENAHSMLPLFIITGDLEITSISGSSVKAGN